MAKIIERLSRGLRRLRQRNALYAELSALDPEEQRKFCADVGVTPTDMSRILDGSLDHSLLERMLRRVGVDPVTLTRMHPREERDLRTACAQCTSWSRCSHELDAGTGEGVPAYCPNRPTILALAQQARSP